MLAGELYQAMDPELVEMRKRARRLARAYNQTTEEEDGRRQEILGELFGGKAGRAVIEPPFHLDYGRNIYVGKEFFMNFGGVILDCAEVHIGDSVLCGPNVQIYTATHPMDPETRAAGPEFAKPIRIGNRVWLGGGVILCPGVSIGENSVIGAGAVVTKDIPANVFAAGNPCRVIRAITESDRPGAR